jgi:DNA-directed RNA polymerase subunit RPC12/RpoP
MRKLKATLTEIAVTPPTASFKEGESYICAVCELPVRKCNADETVRCSNMLLVGTELQLLRDTGKGRSVLCIRCGNPLAKRILAKNPLAELCPTCQQSSPKIKTSQRSKGASQ